MQAWPVATDNGLIFHTGATLPLKKGGDQWRRQDFVSWGHDDRGAEGASIKTPSGVGYGQ